jgi:hypothetical protein
MENTMSFDDWKEQDKGELRNWLKGVLKTEVVNLTFKKKDDTIRVMSCTLNPKDVVEYERKTERVRAVNEDVLSVFDLEKQEWRSVRLDSIQEIGFTLGK